MPSYEVQQYSENGAFRGLRIEKRNYGLGHEERLNGTHYTVLAQRFLTGAKPKKSWWDRIRGR